MKSTKSMRILRDPNMRWKRRKNSRANYIPKKLKPGPRIGIRGKKRMVAITLSRTARETLRELARFSHMSASAWLEAEILATPARLAAPQIRAEEASVAPRSIEPIRKALIETIPSTAIETDLPTLTGEKDGK